MKKILLTILLAATLATPALVFAQATKTAPPLDYSGFVKCDGVVKTGENAEPGRDRVCDFAALMDTVIKAINWMFYIAIPVAVALFAYAGVLYMTGVPGNIGKAKKIFSSVAIGFIIMVTAWIAVRTAVSWFIDDEYKSAAESLVK